MVRVQLLELWLPGHTARRTTLVRDRRPKTSARSSCDERLIHTTHCRMKCADSLDLAPPDPHIDCMMCTVNMGADRSSGGREALEVSPIGALVDALGGPGLSGVPADTRAEWYETLTRAALAIDDLSCAERWAELAQAAVEREESGGDRAFATLAAAHVAAASGRHDSAGAHARLAASMFTAAGRRHDAHRAQLVEAAVQPRPNPRKPLDVVVPLQEIGRLTKRTSERLDLVRLTRREWEVAELVADGLSNRAIAAELVLSVRTVERHLARMFTKLDIGSRARLAALVVAFHAGDDPQTAV